MMRWVLAVLVLLMAAGGVAADHIHTDAYGTYSTSGDDATGTAVIFWDNTTLDATVIYSGHINRYWQDATYSMYLKKYVVGWVTLCSDSQWASGCVLRSVSCSGTHDQAVGICRYGVTSGATAGSSCGTGTKTITVTFISDGDLYQVSGSTACLSGVDLYVYTGGSYEWMNEDDLSDDSYSFDIGLGSDYRLIFSDSAYYDFTCDGNEVFNYDTCLYVYGYTCGIEHIHLWKDDGGWVLEDTYYQATIGVNPYEMVIESGNDYKLNFSDGHEYLFSCTGDHVLYDWDRCPWAYPPNGDPVPIVIYVGYDNRIVLLQDAHGNFIEHSQIAVYDQTDDVYLQKWTDNPEGYLVLTARFDTDHDVQIAVRTFDSVHTTTTIYPMNGTAENLTWTNWTIPIMYNIQMEPVDTYNVPLFDVFCGLAEYTPINPLSFWGMDFNRGYVPVTNCSGFSRCDIVAEKGGYVPYEVTGLNWTSRSAMVKDYRHEIIMTKE